MKHIFNCLLLTFIAVACHMEVPEIVVDFSGDSDRGTVTFKNNTQGADSFTWDFGDGSPVSNEREPVHKYNTTNNYKVRLIAKGNGGSVGHAKVISVNINIASVKTFEKVWEFSYGGSAYDQIRAGVATGDGGAVMVGMSASGGSGGNDMKVIKINSAGAKQWEFNYGGSGNDGASCVMEAPGGGGYFVGGFSNSPKGGAKESDNLGEYDFWLIKIDANGKKLWDRSYGGRQADLMNGMVATSDGGALLGGFSRSDVFGSNKVGAHIGDADMWLVKVSGDGTQLWDKTYGGKNDDRINSMTITPSKVVVLAGYSGSGKEDSKSTDNIGNYDFWVVRVNESGDKIADHTFGGSAADQIYSSLFDNRYVVGGESASEATSGGKDPVLAPRLGGIDFYVYKFDDAGAKTWERTYGGSGDERLNSVIQASDGGLLMAGESNSGTSSTKPAGNNGGIDGWLIKVDATGKLVKDGGYGGSGSDKINCVIKLTDGSYLLAGESNSAVSGNKTSERIGDYDCWVVKIRDN
jgi:PKD repeat protein